jgi:agmatinase
MDLEDQPFSDLGDLDIAGQLLDSSLDLMEQAASTIQAKGGRLLALGGEHTITLPLVKALHTSFPDLVLIHADAHSDLRDEYEGRPINHATVIKRISEIIGPDRLIQLGIRSGTREEFAWMHENGTLLSWNASAAKELSRRVDGRPVYFTLDLDVLDPSCLHATGNPEPGGWFYDDMERLFLALRKMRLIAADVVELNPQLDPSQVGTITASKIVRELLLILGATELQT